MAKASDVLDVDDSQEPTTDLPDAAQGEGSSQDIFDSTMADATFEATLAELASQEGELSADDIRRAVGDAAGDLTDEQLIAEYEKARAGSDEEEGEDAPEPLKFNYPFYDEKGNKIEDLSKLTLADIFAGKVQLGYNAMGKEQRKALADVLRVAANGHLNENKMATSIAERNRVHEQLVALQKEHEAWANDRKVWDRVLSAANAGNIEPLKMLINEYNRALGSAALTPDDGPSDADLNAAGQQYFNTTIAPEAAKIAVSYGADPAEVIQAVQQMIVNEGNFLTQEKLDSIMKYEIQALLEENGFNATATPTTKAPENDMAAQIAALTKQVQELTASKSNAAVRIARTRKVPPAGGGSTPSAGDAVPNFKSRQDMKKWMRGEE